MRALDGSRISFAADGTHSWHGISKKLKVKSRKLLKQLEYFNTV
jgi:hypothetical protein